MNAAPSVARYWTLWAHAKGKGLNNDAAQLYATMCWWGLHYGLAAPPIHSGYRSARQQRKLRERWDRGDRAGLVVRPADDSPHTDRRAFDLQRVPHLHVYGEWAPYINPRARWGGNFRGVHAGDDVHFDVPG